MHRRWIVNKTNQDYIAYLSKASSVSPILTQILVNRGIKTPEAITSFLNPRISCLSDPFLIEGMIAAVERIMSAGQKNERVLVHGDYDVDGISATAITLKALHLCGIDCFSFIPDRMSHGYGFNPPAVEYAKQIGAKLIVTVDCGITSFDAAALCRKEGLDLIITDHHEPIRQQSSEFNVQGSKGLKNKNSETLVPEAYAIVNPKISIPDSEFSLLSGAGIALKLAQALLTKAYEGFTMHDFVDLAALGTMGDIVPLSGENRLIVKEGLKVLEKSSRPGIRALKKIAGLEGKPLKTGHLLFALIPRINAAGRIANAENVLRLLITDSEDEAYDLASWLDGCNRERQQVEEAVYQEAMQQLGQKGIRSVIVLSSEGWHKGVIGIVASRITDAVYRPTFILSLEGNIARGSARSIPPFDIYFALTRCKSHLRGFGGHRQAAGLELAIGEIQSFEECVNSVAEESLSPDDFIPELKIDATVDLSDITFDLTREFDMLEPFGFGNPAPLLGSKGLEVIYPKIVKDLHLKMKLRQENQSLNAIGFDMASVYHKIEASPTVDAVFTPYVNVWEGNKSIQLNLKALRPGT